MNTEATHEQNATLSTGQRLREAREKLGLSQQAVAERLCLKVSTVREIEEDSLPSDLAATFLRGYIRSYARVVHIPEDELLPTVKKEEPARSVKMNSVQGMSLSKRRKKRDGWLWSFTFLVLFVVVGLTGAWWWQNHKAQQEEISTMADQTSARLNTGNHNGQSVPLDIGDHGAMAASSNNVTESAQPPAAASASAVSPEQAAAAPSSTNVVTDSQPPAAPVQEQQPAPPVSPVASAATDEAQVPTADSNALVMNFNAECWLEVSDATGKKLFSGTKYSGGSLNLTGQAPYKLKIGAPAAVQIQYQGKPVDLSRFIRTNQVARLTLNAEQSVAQ